MPPEQPQDELRDAIHQFVYQERPSWHQGNVIKHDDDSVIHETGD